MHRPLLLTAAGFLSVIFILTMWMNVLPSTWQYVAIAAAVAAPVFGAYIDGLSRGTMQEPPMLGGEYGLERDVTYEVMSTAPFRYKGDYSLLRWLSGNVIPEQEMRCVTVRTLSGPHEGRIRVVLHPMELPKRFYWNNDKGLVNQNLA